MSARTRRLRADLYRLLASCGGRAYGPWVTRQLLERGHALRSIYYCRRGMVRAGGKGTWELLEKRSRRAPRRRAGGLTAAFTRE